jgi:secondary thiamine-phosphate synthase enzyme
MRSFKVATESRSGLVDITDRVRKAADSVGLKNGIIFLYVPHTTAGLTVNENADPSVKRDILMKMNSMVPEDEGYGHAEGNSDSHIKSSLFGNEMFFFVEEGSLKLGTWQGIFFAEFDGPRDREVHFRVIQDL